MSGCLLSIVLGAFFGCHYEVYCTVRERETLSLTEATCEGRVHSLVARWSIQRYSSQRHSSQYIIKITTIVASKKVLFLKLLSGFEICVYMLL